MKTLLKALDQQGEAPCTKFACPKFTACAEGRLACSAFAYYVQSGNAVHPFNEVAHRARGTGRLIFRGSVEPTRELYNEVESDTWAAASGGGGWEHRKAEASDELIRQTIDESGRIGLQSWLTTSLERAATTLRRHQEAACQDDQN